MTTQAPDPGADDKRGQPGEELNPEDPGQARERAMRGRLHQNLRGLGFRRGDGDKLAADNPAQKRLPFEEAGKRLVALGHVRFLDKVARFGHHVADCGHCRARRQHAGWPVGCHGLNADNRGPVFGGKGHAEPRSVKRHKKSNKGHYEPAKDGKNENRKWRQTLEQLSGVSVGPIYLPLYHCRAASTSPVQVMPLQPALRYFYVRQHRLT